MKKSQLFTRTSKTVPADETAKNAQLLIRAGFVHKEMAGVYTLLPLGLRVVENIIAIVKKEMDGIGGVQMKTSALQNKDVWEQTNRWDDKIVDNWFKTTLKNGTEVGLSFTNEEAYSNLMRSFITSYKDLPVYAYDFKTIFRNETRSKSGLMRGREFYWKALYSFSANEQSHNEFYERAKEAYQRVYQQLGLGNGTYLTFASGGTFSKYSHEFQTVSEVGEDTIYIDEEQRIAVNKEVYTDEVLADLGLDKSKLVEKRAIEVGNIFSLGHKFSEPFGLTYADENGQDKLVFMGSYGIGITRLLGVVAEQLSDEKGLVWPVSVAPFSVCLVQLGDDSAVAEAAEKLYEELQKAGIEVLYDDRDARAGEKFADADLVGIPYRLVVSLKTLESGSVEFKSRTENDTELVKFDEIAKKLASLV